MPFHEGAASGVRIPFRQFGCRRRTVAFPVGLGFHAFHVPEVKRVIEIDGVRLDFGRRDVQMVLGRNHPRIAFRV